ncbi:hypothetical protein RchiOBHm_Chr2g0106961 [Rosa chinensis]|uniref:Maternal effect embryo arrest 59 n=1 Tax=Rosa chinensis TaxID=74649 RepID=A0A2P6RNU8_ROSCH|nr:uncharacterized protein LOC112184377 [Rosa chinensis]PRQ48102.1 hypothetical protein RchiOBHm_Chr2g0106961 [Rosa chinensis]
MVGQWTVAKPSRSDDVLDADEQLRIATQIKAQFDSAAPKRPMKPNRSEPDSPAPALSIVDPTNIPELHKLRTLQSQSHVRISDEGASIVVQDEFVDTQYYKELNSIDKQHHMTGTGFIRVEREEEGNEDGYDIQLNGIHGGSNGMVRAGFRSNPATNEWIPKTDEDLVFISSKPNRSEN